MKEALSFIITSLVDHPNIVAITETEENGIVTLSVKVDKEDMGKIIGKNGKVIQSIRNVMKIKAMKNNKKINITLAEEQTA